ncbi:MAG: ATP-binding protein [Pseudomonadota bacterium]
MKSVKQRSLFRRLLYGFMAVMLVIWMAALAYMAYLSTVNQARVTALLNASSARKVLLVSSAAPHPEAIRRNGEIMELLRKDLDEKMGIHAANQTRVWKGGQQVYSSVQGERAALPPASAGCNQTTAGWVHCVERDAATGITVESVQQVIDGWLFITSSAGFLLTPLVLSLPFLLLPAWFIVAVCLRPLRTIIAAIEQRSDTDLTPLPVSAYMELSPLVGAINRLMHRLTERMAREQEFLTDAAHELKTPLAVIQINSHLLIAHDGEPAAPGLRQARDGLREGLARATRTIHQLLAFERANTESASHARTSASLSALVRDHLALAAPLAMQRAIEIELDAAAPFSLAVDRESMGSLLDNVISNAVKYSPHGGRIMVRLHASEDHIRLAVSDQGPGIPSHLRAKVFERFYRIPGQDAAGSGLGLSIAKRAAARNGATISLASGEHGTGLTVLIDFAC